jgi:type I restriction enzyme M protein
MATSCLTTTATLLEKLGQEKGTLGLIFGKAQNKFQDPAKLRRVIVDLIDAETWTILGADVKGDAYEGLLEKNAQDTKSGAGQYFTPARADPGHGGLHRPAAGRAHHRPGLRHGRLFVHRAQLHGGHNKSLTREQLKHLKEKAFTGYELVQGTARVRHEHDAARHWLRKAVPVVVGDALAADPGERFEVVLANPPFGKKSSTVIVGEDGRTSTEKDTIERDDFWATTSNKQLNFVQHIKTLLATHGRAAVVLPDNVLFEGGAGETIRKKLLHECDVHTLLRLPTGLFYAQGVKANVLFFEKKGASETPWTKQLWIYDLRTNKHFTLKTNPLTRADLNEFVELYRRATATSAQATWSAKGSGPDGRWRAYSYDELMARDKTSLDIFWLKDDSLADSDNLPPPGVIALEIVEDLEAALEQFG